jgi:hypothetical protein
MHINIYREIMAALNHAADNGATVPECGAASMGFRLGYQTAITAVRDRFNSQRLGQRMNAVQRRVDEVAESDDKIVAALKTRLDGLKHERHMIKATGPSKYRQAGAERKTPTEDRMIALLESILRGEGCKVVPCPPTAEPAPEPTRTGNIGLPTHKGRK